MGIDTQKGPPVAKQPIDLTSFLVEPWYRRGDGAGDISDCGETRRTSIPAIIDAKPEPGSPRVQAGSKVFLMARDDHTVEVLAPSPPRRIGYILGETGEAIARRCREKVGSLMGTVLPENGFGRQQLRIEINGY